MTHSPFSRELVTQNYIRTPIIFAHEKRILRWTSTREDVVAMSPVTLFVFDLVTGKEIQELHLNRANGPSTRLSKDGKYIALRADNGDLEIWNWL